MAPKDGVRCWVCGRTIEEVQQSIGNPAAEVTDVDRNMARVADMRARFAKAAGDWWDSVPDQFKNMDFNFVMGNPAQFKALRFIDDVEQARKTHVETLAEIAMRARKGEEFTVGEFRVDSNDAKHRDVIVRELDEFERRTGRSLTEETENSRPKEFDGLKLGEGLRYLRDVGSLYYVLQQRMLEVDKEEERKKLPTFSIGMARIKGFPKAVPLCTVCESLIKGL
jgi:hypothetical protein